MSRYYYGQYARAAQQARTQDGTKEETGTLAEAYAVLWLLPGAPAAVVKAAYRALAAQYHPDAGGDLELMVRLNAAYAAIRRHQEAGCG
jgi:DnaJ-class molecular chaperone